ncbi:MAG: alcohol dehydrogenase catalytic domain-containing protein [Halioglobus sp.]
MGEHDVKIKVKAAGLNFPDVLIIQGKYQFQPELPFIPGNECSGEVLAVGSAGDPASPATRSLPPRVPGHSASRSGGVRTWFFPNPRP